MSQQLTRLKNLSTQAWLITIIRIIVFATLLVGAPKKLFVYHFQIIHNAEETKSIGSNTKYNLVYFLILGSLSFDEELLRFFSKRRD